LDENESTSDKKKVKCNGCFRDISYHDYSTGRLWKHLTKHLNKEKVEELKRENLTEEKVGIF
jgi:hypothetical protein